MLSKIASIALAGIVSGVAYLAAQSLDMSAARNRVDDRVLLGRLLPVSPSQATTAGTIMHLVNSVVFSAAFRLVGRDLLKGPMWFRGATFALIENVVLYPLVLLEDFHPALRDGQMDSFQSWTAFAQAMWRHLVLGVVLGALTPRKN